VDKVKINATVAVIELLCLIVKSRPHIQALLIFADTQSQNEKPKELEF